MIEIERVSKAYDDRAIVSDLTLNVPKGALCVLLGPSGCGKSTTLRMINRLVPFDSGTVRVGGEDVLRVAPEALRRRIGYAIQSTGLFPHWRVEDNIATVPRLLGWPEARVRDRVSELLTLLRLDPATYRGKYTSYRAASSSARRRRPSARRRTRPLADGRTLRRARPDHPRRAANRDRPHPPGDRQDHRLRDPRHRGGAAPRDDDRHPRPRAASRRRPGAPLEIVEHPASDFVRDFVGVQGIGLEVALGPQGRRADAERRQAPRARAIAADRQRSSMRWRR